MGKTFKANDVIVVAENETYLRPQKDPHAKFQSKHPKVHRQGNAKRDWRNTYQAE